MLTPDRASVPPPLVVRPPEPVSDELIVVVPLATSKVVPPEEGRLIEPDWSTTFPLVTVILLADTAPEIVTTPADPVNTAWAPLTQGMSWPVIGSYQQFPLPVAQVPLPPRPAPVPVRLLDAVPSASQYSVNGAICTMHTASATTEPLAASEIRTLRVPVLAWKTPRLCQFWPSSVASLGAACWLSWTVASATPPSSTVKGVLLAWAPDSFHVANN